ncbi:HipA N-terminal domain-containing protein [Lachnospiraceae bacterium NK3A20]|nr:HipA N-terminal domain-containing protein [Lachnospiraceae bacterium NK3A20]
MKLNVSIEIHGSQIPVGTITGNSGQSAVFTYLPEYLHSDTAVPISVSLPLQEEPFSARRTANFFEGLLPEGFTRHSVAQWMHTDEGDYLAILAGLGKECLGAIQVLEDDARAEAPSYEPLSGRSKGSRPRRGREINRYGRQIASLTRRRGEI